LGGGEGNHPYLEEAGKKKKSCLIVGGKKKKIGEVKTFHPESAEFKKMGKICDNVLGIQNKGVHPLQNHPPFGHQRKKAPKERKKKVSIGGNSSGGGGEAGQGTPLSVRVFCGGGVFFFWGVVLGGGVGNAVGNGVPERSDLLLRSRTQKTRCGKNRRRGGPSTKKGRASFKGESGDQTTALGRGGHQRHDFKSKSRQLGPRVGTVANPAVSRSPKVKETLKK